MKIITIGLDIRIRHEDLQAVLDAISPYLVTDDENTPAPVETGRLDLMRPARSVDWKAGIREIFSEHTGEAYSTNRIVTMMTEANIKISRVAVSNYLSELADEGKLERIGTGRYQAYRSNSPFAMM